MVMRKYIYTICALLFLASCQKDEVITGSAKQTSAFDKIEIDGSFDVIWAEDSVFSVQFAADRIFFDALSYELNDGVLIIHDGKSPRWRNPEAKKPMVRISGNTDELKIWNFAIMKVDASACTTRYAWVENASKSDVLVNVQEQIDYAIGGKGNILVQGNPQKLVELNPATDSGEIILSP